MTNIIKYEWGNLELGTSICQHEILKEIYYGQTDVRPSICMKCGINKLLQSYISITIYNEINSVYVVCEAIIYSQWEGAYDAMIKFVWKTNEKG